MWQRVEEIRREGRPPVASDPVLEPLLATMLEEEWKAGVHEWAYSSQQPNLVPGPLHNVDSPLFQESLDLVQLAAHELDLTERAVSNRLRRVHELCDPKRLWIAETDVMSRIFLVAGPGPAMLTRYCQAARVMRRRDFYGRSIPGWGEQPDHPFWKRFQLAATTARTEGWQPPNVALWGDGPPNVDPKGKFAFLRRLLVDRGHQYRERPEVPGLRPEDARGWYRLARLVARSAIESPGPEVVAEWVTAIKSGRFTLGLYPNQCPSCHRWGEHGLKQGRCVSCSVVEGSPAAFTAEVYQDVRRLGHIEASKGGVRHSADWEPARYTLKGDRVFDGWGGPVFHGFEVDRAWDLLIDQGQVRSRRDERGQNADPGDVDRLSVKQKSKLEESEAELDWHCPECDRVWSLGDPGAPSAPAPGTCERCGGRVVPPDVGTLWRGAPA